MDLPKKLEIKPFPLEKEFQIAHVRQRLGELSREDLEKFLAEALDTMSRLAFQVTQLHDYIEELEGKND